MSFQFFFKSRFLTLAPFLGSPSGRFFPDVRPNGVFQISARSENTPLLPVFWCLSIFRNTISDFSLMFGVAFGPFFHGFRPNGVFQISARSENTPMMPVFWWLSIFQITIFDFGPIWGLAVGPLFSGIFGQTVFFFQISARPEKNTLFCMCFSFSWLS